MQHEPLPDVAAAVLFVFALWLGLVSLSVFEILQTACPFVHASPQASLVVVLQVAVVLVVLVALPAEPF